VSDGATGKAGASQPRSAVLAEFEARGFVGRPGLTITVAATAGLFAMAISFAFEPPVTVSMLALVAGVLLVLGFRAGDTRYRLTAAGIHRSFRPLAASLFRLPVRAQFFPLTDIRFYRRERDWSRYRAEEVESLTLALRRPPYRMVIHDMADRPGFLAFADRFEELAANDQAPIRRKPGFYQTGWAKGITVVFAALAAGLVVLFAMGMLGPTAVFRLLVVIVPGVLYMAYRAFGTRPAAGKQD